MFRKNCSNRKQQIGYLKEIEMKENVVVFVIAVYWGLNRIAIAAQRSSSGNSRKKISFRNRDRTVVAGTDDGRTKKQKTCPFIVRAKKCG